MTQEGRFRKGEAVLFPNLLPYAKYSSVAVYSAALHSIPLGELSPRLVADNLAVQVESIFTLGFAAGCELSSIYGFLAGA